MPWLLPGAGGSLVAHSRVGIELEVGTTMRWRSSTGLRTGVVGLLAAAFLAGTMPANGATSADVVDHTPGAEHVPPLAAPDPGDAAAVETHTEDIVVSESGRALPSPEAGERTLVSAEVPSIAVVGVTWSELEASGGSDLSLQIRSLEDGSWTDWTDLEVDTDAPDGAERDGSEPMSVLGATRVEVQVSADAGAVPDDAVVHIVDPGETPRDQDVSPLAASAAVDTAAAATGAATTGAPTVFSRADWGADESLRGWRPQLGRVTGAVIHHTAGRNDYSEDEVPAIIRGIYRYHAVSLGWGDIGYNALVDRFGRIWEGRFGGLTHPIIAGHASGVNSTTFGVSVMGEFTTAAVPEPAMDAVAQVTAWKLALHGVPLAGDGVRGDGTLLPGRIVGHRDVGATACPGDAFYARMDDLRDRVAGLYPSMPRPPQPDPASVRLGGSDRYSTSSATSQWVFGRADVVYVATGHDYADALAATPAAALTRSPVLLVRPGSVPAATADELRRLRPSRIVVLGGPAAVSKTTLAELGALAPTVEVVAGLDRFDTSAQMSQGAWSSAGTVFVASGQAAPDALGAAAAAAAGRFPLLLVGRAALPPTVAAELVRLSPSTVVVVGGPTVVSDAVTAAISATVPGATVERVGGADRYATSAMLVERSWADADAVFHATGEDWPDALSASAAAAETEAPVLLVRPTCTPAPVRQLLRIITPAVEYMVGGPAAVDSAATRTGC